MQKHFRLRTGSLLLLLAAVGLFLISNWPLPRQRETRDFPAAYSLDNSEIAPVILHRVIFTSIPQKMRTGEVATVKLEFAPVVTTQTKEWIVEESQGAYFLETRLEIPGMQVNPQGSFTQPVVPGNTLHYNWEFISQQNGNYQGTLWVYLVVVNETTAIPEHLPVLALPVQVEVVGLPFLSVKLLRIAAGLCIVIALLMTLLRYVTKHMEGEQPNTPTG